MGVWEWQYSEEEEAEELLLSKDSELVLDSLGEMMTVIMITTCRAWGDAPRPSSPLDRWGH